MPTYEITCENRTTLEGANYKCTVKSAKALNKHIIVDGIKEVNIETPSNRSRLLASYNSYHTGLDQESEPVCKFSKLRGGILNCYTKEYWERRVKR